MLDIILTPRQRAILAVLALRSLGGPGSGNFGHSGRPGQVGGSTAAGSSTISDKSGKQYKVAFNAQTRTYTVSEPDAPRGVTIASATMTRKEGAHKGKSVMSVNVVPEMQKRGIATALYEYIENHIGEKLVPNWALTPEGEALWRSRSRRALGGRGSGNFGHAGRPGERGGSGAGGARSERSARALKHFKPIHATAQRAAERNESKVAEMIKGQLPEEYNAPIDVVVKVNGKLIGIEVKSLVNNTNDKITMRRAAVEKKIAWSRSQRAGLRTVVIDDRPSGKGAIYYSKGVGSFRVGSMVRVQNAQHLTLLLGASR